MTVAVSMKHRQQIKGVSVRVIAKRLSESYLAANTQYVMLM